MTKTRTRTRRVLLEALAGLLLGLVILGSIGVYRLSSGPISVGVLTPIIESALNPDRSPFRVTVGDTRIVWAGWDRALDVVAVNVAVGDEGVPPSAIFPEVSIGISIRGLLSREIRVTSLDLLRPSLALTIDVDGRVQLAFDEVAHTIDGDALAPDPVQDTSLDFGEIGTDSSLLPPGILDLLLSMPDEDSALGGLQRFSLLGATIRIVDERVGEELWLNDASIEFSRTEEGLQAHLQTTIETVRDDTRVRIGLLVNPADESIDFDIRTDAFNLDLLARYVPGLAPFLPDLTASSIVNIRLDLGGRFEHATVIMDTTAGSLDAQIDNALSPDSLSVTLDLEDLRLRDWVSGAEALEGAREFTPNVLVTGTTDFLVSVTDGLMTASGILYSDVGAVSFEGMLDDESNQYLVGLGVSGLRPDLVAGALPLAEDLTSFEIPLQGTAQLALDRDFRLLAGRTDVEFGAGSMQIPGLIETLPPVASGHLSVRLPDPQSPLIVEELSVAFEGGPVVSANADVSFGDQAVSLAVNALALDLKMREVANFWPESIGTNPREWVLENLPDANVHQAGLVAELVVPLNSFGDAEVISVDGGIRFDNAEVHYLRPMPPVLNVSGMAEFDASTFRIQIYGGELDDAFVRRGSINMFDLDTDTEQIDIDISIETPLATAFAVLDSEPRRYISRLGLSTEGVAGTALADVRFDFPLLLDLEADDIVYGADAVLSDLVLEQPDLDFPIRAQSVTLSLVPGQLSVNGDVDLQGTTAQAHWVETFADDADVVRQIELTAIDQLSALSKFGLNLTGIAEGPAGLSLNYLVYASDAQSLSLSANLDEANLTIDAIGWEKEPGVPSILSVQGLIGTDGTIDARTLKLDGGDDHLFEGAATFLPEFSDLIAARFDRIRFGLTDISGTAELRDGLYVIDLTGEQFDAAHFLHDEDEEEDAEAVEEEDTGEPQVRVRGRFNTLYDGPDRAVQDADFLVETHGSEIHQLTLNGLLGDNKAIDIRYLPTGGGGAELLVLAEDTGLALSMADLTGRLDGGSMRIEGLRVGRDEPMNGTILLQDFTFREAPRLAKLLEVISVTGILSALSNEGLPFNRLVADFSLTEDRLTIRDGSARGNSLGITFEGDFDRQTDEVAINGDIAVSDIFSRTIGQLPIIDLLVGDGLIGAAYRMTGPVDDPNVSVNPLSVIAPGFLRRVFGANTQSDGEPDGSGQSPGVGDGRSGADR